MTLLDETKIRAALVGLKGWTLEGGKLHRDLRFPSFAYAIGFMTTAAVEIEKRNHHPEWCNVYNQVKVDLTTHSAGGVTQKDLDLAVMLDGIAQKLGCE